MRGQLRYWLRALVGAETTDLSAVWDRESAVFGSTGRGSAVSVRMTPLEPDRTDKTPLMPHRQDKKSPEQAILPDTPVTLKFVTRPGVPFPADFNAALSVWLLLGGVGKRSRRMFGAFQVTRANGDQWWAQPPDSSQALAALIKAELQAAIPQAGSFRSVPRFPTLNPAHSWVMVGHAAFNSAEEVNVALFRDLLRDKYRQHEEHFGKVGRGGRVASPLHAQVRRIENDYYPVLTYMRSDMGNVRLDPKVINDFRRDAEKRFDGETVWGGNFS